MTETVIEERATTKGDQWRERIAEQERSGVSVKRFCKDRGIGEHLFYYGRKRLREQQRPMRFALVETKRAAQQPEVSLELMLANGARLRIGVGVDGTTLRTVLEALRG